MRFRATALQQLLLGSVAVVGLGVSASPVMARDNIVKYNIPAQGVEKALRDFGLQNGMTVMADAAIVRGKRTAGLTGQSDPDTALRTLLKGTGLTFQRDGSVFVIKPVGNENIPAVEHVQAPSDLEIVVTAQKKEEKIIDVPIAMTALSADALDDRKIEGGSELLRAIPNVNFSKSNFSMYNFSIRGIGTKAVSASSDPAVAVSFNNTPLVRNRLFEAEFFDLQRVEVLRGPQGTLYGRNATAGVVNMIPMLPTPNFGGEVKAEVGSFETKRLTGILNVPLSDTLGVRVAGAMTKRDGFDYNSFTNRRVNGRDLWSTRASVAWEPSDQFKANLIWQHFEEDDDRARTGKQLCHNDPGPVQIGSVILSEGARAKLSQGCKAGSLYDDAAFGVPNGRSLVYIERASSISLGQQYNPNHPAGRGGPSVYLVNVKDPYENLTQSRDLREINSNYDPKFRAKNDVLQFNMDFGLSEGLKFISQTAYSKDDYYSTQDYNRFVTNPIFGDSEGLVDSLGRLIPGTPPTPKGVYCDPNLGCSDRMLTADISRSDNRQWSQEFRLQSDYSGPVNFNLGVNYMDFKSKDDYFVFNNLFTLLADYYFSRGVRTHDTLECGLGYEGRECPYVDRNSLDNLDEQGHNYFLSQNGVRIKSLGVFGELYVDLGDNLKLTVGARYTRDKKISTQIPSQLLLGGGTKNPSGAAYIGDITGGRVNSGYPALPDIAQKWTKPTGRIVLDWKPDLSFTDDTLIYASASRGYKGGGTNPPRVDFNPAVVQYQFLPQTFRPEFINAFEIGTKNSFWGGRLTLNANAFFYDYKDYQISQIVDRIAFNENFDATVWGLEFEGAWRPTRALRLDGNLGFLKSRLKSGSQSIDVMDRTQGDPDWVVVRSWLQVPSNCIAPRVLVERVLQQNPNGGDGLHQLCPGATRVGSFNPAVDTKYPVYERYGFTYDFFAPYNPDTVGLDIADGGSGAPNGGRGFFADLEGNELPNSPRWTVNFGAQYTFFLNRGDWELTVRGDYYRQSKSFARIYNTAYDRLRSWDNVNAAISLERPDSGLTFQLYVKNIFDDAPITDFFTNSDDTGLTTNVFTLDPRIVGFNVRKTF